MTTAVLIHGFSGGPGSWRRVAGRLRMRTWAPAVCGHGAGASAAAVPRSFEAEVDRLAAAVGAAAPPPRYVVGYSLGGRLALGLLVRHPDLFVGASLIGANPGIEGGSERQARRTADEAWARLLEEQGLAVFDREWSSLPLFGSQRGLDAGIIEEQRRVRLDHDPEALAAAMRTLSPGAMPNYRPLLPGITCPVELIAGGLDAKFVALARRMAGRLPGGTLRLVDGAGHNVPLEAPTELACLLNRALERCDRFLPSRRTACCSGAGRSGETDRQSGDAACRQYR